MARVTIIADASFCDKTKAAGYGVWVAGDYGRGPFSGPLPAPLCNNTAEIMAVANALWHAASSNFIRKGTSILIKTDSVTAIRLFNQDRYPKNEQQTIALTFFNKIKNELGLVIHLSHIHGHTGRKEPGNVAQQKCDNAAKEEMIKERSRITGLKPKAINHGKRRKVSYLRMTVNRSHNGQAI